MRYYRSHGQPRLFWAKLALVLAALALFPIFGGVLALLALAAASIGGVLHAKIPSRYGGRPLLWTAVALALVGFLASTGEAALFLRWKLAQAAEQKTQISSRRLWEWASAVESYRIDVGFYPGVAGASAVEMELVPTYAPALPSEDAWGGRFVYESDGQTCSISTIPPPAPDGAIVNTSQLPALRYVGAFPAMPPQPPAVGPPVPWPPVREE